MRHVSLLAKGYQENIRRGFFARAQNMRGVSLGIFLCAKSIRDVSLEGTFAHILKCGHIRPHAHLAALLELLEVQNQHSQILLLRHVSGRF